MTSNKAITVIIFINFKRYKRCIHLFKLFLIQNSPLFRRCFCTLSYSVWELWSLTLKNSKISPWLLLLQIINFREQDVLYNDNTCMSNYCFTGLRRQVIYDIKRCNVQVLFKSVQTTVSSTTCDKSLITDKPEMLFYTRGLLKASNFLFSECIPNV